MTALTKLSAEELATLQRLAEGAPATAPSWPVKVSSVTLLRLLAQVREAEARLAQFGDVKPGDVIRYPLYRFGKEYDSEDRTVEVFRGCLGVFRSGNDRTARVFTPLVDLYMPAKDSTKGYIPNYGEYETSWVPSFVVVSPPPAREGETK